MQKIPFILALILLVYALYLSYALDQPDNLAEEIVENVIENNTGLDIDLTPHSKEN